MKKLLILGLIVLLNIFSTNIATAEEFKTPSDLQIHMRKNFTYHEDVIVRDYFDYFQLPQILEFTKVGDCDDFALYSWYYLTEMGYQAIPFVFWGTSYEGEKYGHAITVFLDDDGTYSIFSNTLLFKTKQTNPLDAILDVFKTWDVIAIWTPTKFGLVHYEEFEKDIKPPGREHSGPGCWPERPGRW